MKRDYTSCSSRQLSTSERRSTRRSWSSATNWGYIRPWRTQGPQTSAELAERTSTAERYVREWLRAQAAGGYVAYDPDTDRYHLSEEQAMMLADEHSPAFVPGAFQVATAAAKIAPRLAEAFRSGEGIGWHEHDAGLFHGTERFFRLNYAANLINAWIPALTGVETKLKTGARVADVGCGYGASTILMAQAYPNSTFAGFDYHEPSMVHRRSTGQHPMDRGGL